MKASYHWLKALLPGLDLSPSDLAERFIFAGVAVDSISEYGAGTADIVVAAVLKIEPHPKREKLRLVTVDRGAGVEQRVVCGAPNVPLPGGLVCFAPTGTTLPAAGMTLTPRDIGGVISEGMLCSEGELGLTGSSKGGAASPDGDHGILILPAGTAKPGTPLRAAIPAVHDYIFDIDLTANRPDCLGHVGLAREASALLGRTFAQQPPEAPKRVTHDAIGKHVTVTIEDTGRCPHYGAAMVVDLTVAPSPLWLRYRLESLGIRAISNLVDITNLILLEFGHPMHAFDFDLGARREDHRATRPRGRGAEDARRRRDRERAPFQAGDPRQLRRIPALHAPLLVPRGLGAGTGAGALSPLHHPPRPRPALRRDQGARRRHECLP